MASEKLFILWGHDRARIVGLFGDGEVTDDNIRAFFEEYPDSDPNVQVVEFKTDEERRTYLAGVDDALGWEAYHAISDTQDFELLRQMIRVYVEDHPEYEAYLEARNHFPQYAGLGGERLSELVRKVAAEIAVDINEKGIEGQLDYLKWRGWDIERIKQELADTAEAPE